VAPLGVVAGSIVTVVDMRRNFALERSEADAGYVLTRQSFPASERATLDYDA
jgi:ring-1,2-phenylacetyl-CoA epoxidase subunit PaaE